MTLKIPLTENRTKASKNNKYEKLTTGTAKERHKLKKIALALFRLYTDSKKINQPLLFTYLRIPQTQIPKLHNHHTFSAPPQRTLKQLSLDLDLQATDIK